MSRQAMIGEAATEEATEEATGDDRGRPLSVRFAVAATLIFAVAQVDVALRRRTNALHARLATRTAAADDLRERRARLRLDTGLAAEAVADAPVGRGLMERAAAAPPAASPRDAAAPVGAPLLWWR